MKTMKNFKFLTVAVFASVLTIVSCSKEDEPVPATIVVAAPVETCTDHFDYENPNNWSHVCTTNNTPNECGSTYRQSPIDIVGAVADATLPILSPIYSSSSTDIVNNGHTIQFNYNGAASDFTFGGETYSLLQFHFHASSEHTFGGTHQALEGHLVHASPSGSLAVIAVFFELGAANPFLDQFTANLPSHAGDTYVDVNLNYAPEDLFPVNQSYYNYNGSLTTPPCSDIVNWIVMEHTSTASQAQLDAFTTLLHSNYRPVQPLSGRTIKHKI